MLAATACIVVIRDSGLRFDCRLFHFQVTTVGKLFTHMYLCRSQWSSSKVTDCGVKGPRFESHSRRLCLPRQPLRQISNKFEWFLLLVRRIPGLTPRWTCQRISKVRLIGPCYSKVKLHRNTPIKKKIQAIFCGWGTAPSQILRLFWKDSVHHALLPRG